MRTQDLGMPATWIERQSERPSTPPQRALTTDGSDDVDLQAAGTEGLLELDKSSLRKSLGVASDGLRGAPTCQLGGTRG